MKGLFDAYIESSKLNSRPISNFTVIIILFHVDDQKISIFWMRFLKVDHCGMGMLPLRNFFWARASPNYIMPCILSVEIQLVISVFKDVYLDEHKILRKTKEKQKLTCWKMADILKDVKKWITPSKINIENFTSRLFYQITFGFCLGAFVIHFRLVHTFTKQF